LRWSIKDNVVVGMRHDGELYVPPFGEDDLYEAIDIILNGKPKVFDPMNAIGENQYSTEQKAEWDKLYNDLPIALDLVLYNGNYELGKYKTKWYDRVWKKIK
jgi:hypothetical protein